MLCDQPHQKQTNLADLEISSDKRWIYERIYLEEGGEEDVSDDAAPLLHQKVQRSVF